MSNNRRLKTDIGYISFGGVVQGNLNPMGRILTGDKRKGCCYSESGFIENLIDCQ
jgi:hypothetical protein